MKTHKQFDKLAEQCYVKTGSVQTDHFDYVKFAELIVRECVELSVNSQYANTKIFAFCLSIDSFNLVKAPLEKL